MTLLDSDTTQRTVTHPLSTLTASEITTAREILDRAGLVTASTQFVYVGLDESVVHAFEPGDNIDRRVRALLLDRATGIGTDNIVSVTAEEVIKTTTLDTAKDGHVPILEPRFQASCRYFQSLCCVVIDRPRGEQWHRHRNAMVCRLCSMQAEPGRFEDQRGSTSAGCDGLSDGAVARNLGQLE
ncbi:hypothetical protein [Rhodococcus sp. 1168]|uniref:hypothetical protein n=1 Tax=Rhodococcus sp. 1168 TaxID=2018041 RepID=UPI000A0A3F6C|nr:hypothetical protein [Rhodococcus sp. 1168]ORI27243.1 hypothetical protein BJI47_02610 [Rhodococcus sp. 1168]